MTRKQYMDKESIKKRAVEIEEAMNSFKRTGFSSQDESGLRKSEIFMLWQIAKHTEEKPITPSDIANNSGITLAGVTHHINSLEEAGCIVRTYSEDDKRVVFITLSKKGKDVVAKFKKKHWQKICGLVECLGDEDSAKMISIMSKISEYMKGENA